MFPAGMTEARSVFLINDNQITSEAFLEDVNNLLNSGEIPNLWEAEEKETINNDIRKAAEEKGVYENFYGFFV